MAVYAISFPLDESSNPLKNDQQSDHLHPLINSDPATVYETGKAKPKQQFANKNTHLTKREATTNNGEQTGKSTTAQKDRKTRATDVHNGQSGKEHQPPNTHNDQVSKTKRENHEPNKNDSTDKQKPKQQPPKSTATHKRETTKNDSTPKQNSPANNDSTRLNRQQNDNVSTNNRNHQKRATNDPNNGKQSKQHDTSKPSKP